MRFSFLFIYLQLKTNIFIFILFKKNVDVLSDAAAAVAPLSQKLQRCADTVNEISKKVRRQ